MRHVRRIHLPALAIFVQLQREEPQGTFRIRSGLPFNDYPPLADVRKIYRQNEWCIWGFCGEKRKQPLHSRPLIKEVSKGINRRVVRNAVTVVYFRTETVLKNLLSKKVTNKKSTLDQDTAAIQPT